MLMGKMPLFKPVQRIVILKYQEEGDRQELLIRIREALLQASSHESGLSHRQMIPEDTWLRKTDASIPRMVLDLSYSKKALRLGIPPSWIGLWWG